MRLGLFFSPSSFDGFVDDVRDAHERGFASVWTPQVFSFDPLTLLAAAGREVPEIELGTSVVPTYPRHPMTLAAHALTTQAATGNRVQLGIGLSHQVVVENMWGYSFDKPARHMREYLDVLLPLLRGEAVTYEGKTLKAMGGLSIADAAAPPVLLAALAPRMLQLAGAVADGTVTWMVGPRTLADHIVPSITSAAEEAGRPAPRVAVGLPVCVTDDVAKAREAAANIFSVYNNLPSYRAMLDKEGAEGPADVAIVGNEAEVAKAVQTLDDNGATDFAAAIYGDATEEARTRDLLSSLL
jgi:F420-dependent oxidoreductase-like protein